MYKIHNEINIMHLFFNLSVYRKVKKINMIKKRRRDKGWNTRVNIFSEMKNIVKSLSGRTRTGWMNLKTDRAKSM